MKHFLLTLSMLLLVTTVSADSPAPRNDYSVLTGDKAHIFVMLGPKKDDRFYGEIDKKLRSKYPQSGLYVLRNTPDKSTPLWTVDWYSFEVYLSSDGTYLVQAGPWAADMVNHSDLGVAFYKDGKLLTSYKVNELMSDTSKVQETVSHYFWRDRDNTKFDSKTNTYFLTTLANDQYTFDITTGKPLNHEPKNH